MKLKEGLVEVYTGSGRGKTTAAFGLAFRASGWGFKTLIIQFMKTGKYGENISSRKMPENIEVRYVGKPYFIAWEEDIPLSDRQNVRNLRLYPKGHPPRDYVEMANSMMDSVEKEMKENRWDIIILDEINVAIYYSLIELKRLINLIDTKPKNVELVFTGRKVDNEIISRASLVTEMVEIKHPYQRGIMARKGIDF
jgi:cob(I)alamin adenosyltransferase